MAFAVAAALWGALLLRAPSQRHALHHLMSALVVAKTLTLLSQAGMYHYIRATGSPDGWNIAFYIFTFLRGVLFFTVRTLCTLDACPGCLVPQPLHGPGSEGSPSLQGVAPYVGAAAAAAAAAVSARAPAHCSASVVVLQA